MEMSHNHVSHNIGLASTPHCTGGGVGEVCEECVNYHNIQKHCYPLPRRTTPALTML